MTLLVGHVTRKTVSEMSYNVSSGTLNSTIPYYTAIVNIALVLFLSYSTLNNIVTLKSGLEVTQGHSDWYHSKFCVRFPIRLP